MTEKCKDHNLLHLHGWRTTTGGLVEESVLDNLSQHSVEDLRGDLAGVRGGLGQFVLGLLIVPIVAHHVSTPAQVVVPGLQLLSKVINLEIVKCEG